MEKIKKPELMLYYFGLEESYLDKRGQNEKCVCVPVGNDVNYFDRDAVGQTAINIQKKYPNIKLTGKEDIVSNKGQKTKELLFFYEEKESQEKK